MLVEGLQKTSHSDAWVLAVSRLDILSMMQHFGVL